MLVTVLIYNSLVFSKLKYLFSSNRENLTQKIEAVSNATRDGLLLIDKNNEITWSNENAKEWLGLNEKYASKNIRSYFPNPNFSVFLREIDSEKTLEVISPTKKENFLSLQIIPFGDEERIIIIRDISKPIKLETIRTDFAANASHELRSPLTVIAGYIDMMQHDDSIPKDWQEPIKELGKQSQRMQSVLSDLLVLFQLESESNEIDDEVIDLEAIANSSKKEAMSRKNPPQSFEVNFSEPALIKGDEFRIQSVVTNIVENALRYSDKKGAIKIYWHTDEKGGHLSIKDNGIGMEDKHLKRITERFYRIDKGRSRDMGGTGLGLAIVKYALQNHNATLEIKSIIGAGSEFICHFPKDRIKK